MRDKEKMPEGLPANAIHLGTFTATGPGEFVLGVVKLKNDEPPPV
jgi:hypothetical protein